MMTSVLQNPYLAVGLRARLARRTTLLMSVGWVAIIALCIELNYFLYSSPNFDAYQSKEYCFSSIFFQLLAVQFFLVLFPTAYSCSNSVSLERSTRSLPLLRAAPMSGSAIAFGKVVSDPARIWLLIVLGFPFTSICAAVGKVELATFVQGYALLLAAGFFACSLGLLSSVLAKTLTKRGQAGGNAIVLIGLMLFMSQGAYKTPQMNTLAGLSPMPFFVRSITERFPLPIPVDINLKLNFLGAEVNPFFVSFALYVLLGTGCFIGAARRIGDDNVPVLSRAQTLCAFILYQLAVCGMLVNSFHPVRGVAGKPGALPLTGSVPMRTYAIYTLLGLLVAAVVSTPVRNRVESALRRPGRKARFGWRWLTDDAASALPLLGLLFALTTCGYVFLARMVQTHANYPLSVAAFVTGAAMLFFCVAVFSLIIQSCYLAPGKHPIAVAAIALVLYFVLPSIVSGIIQLSTGGEVPTDYIYVVNPMFALTRALGRGGEGYLSTQTTFLRLGTGVYVMTIALLPVAIRSQIQRLRRHIDNMRKL